MDVRTIGEKAGTWFPFVVLAAGAVAVWQPDPFTSLGPAVP